jgi:hypothetical protein
MGRAFPWLSSAPGATRSFCWASREPTCRRQTRLRSRVTRDRMHTTHGPACADAQACGVSRHAACDDPLTHRAFHCLGATVPTDVRDRQAAHPLPPPAPPGAAPLGTSDNAALSDVARCHRPCRSFLCRRAIAFRVVHVRLRSRVWQALRQRPALPPLVHNGHYVHSRRRGASGDLDDPLALRDLGVDLGIDHAFGRHVDLHAATSAVPFRAQQRLRARERRARTGATRGELIRESLRRPLVRTPCVHEARTCGLSPRIRASTRDVGGLVERAQRLDERAPWPPPAWACNVKWSCVSCDTNFRTRCCPDRGWSKPSPSSPCACTARRAPQPSRRSCPAGAEATSVPPRRPAGACPGASPRGAEASRRSRAVP